MNIYLDNAASTPLDPEVFAHMTPYFCEQIGNPSSTHAHGRNLRNLIEQARRTIAGHIGANPGEIYFTSGGTEADNMAIVGAVQAYPITHIISTVIEHHAVTHTIEHLEAAGKIKAIWLPLDQKGNIDLEDLRAALQEAPKALVSLMHANNEIGTLHDIHAIGELCKEHDALFHSDTVQTMGTLAYDVSSLNVDFLAASAHKFYGPKGVGFLYIRKGIKIPSLILGGSQERNMRPGTENLPGILGMAYAFDKCYKNLQHKNEHLWSLKTYMKEQLERHLPGVSFNGETEAGKSNPTVLNVAMPCNEADCMLLFNLDIHGISVSGGSACNSGANLGSHVLRGIGASRNALMNSIRFSFGMPNTKEEIDITIGKLQEIVKQPVI